MAAPVGPRARRPLLRLLTKAIGGFHAGASNDDDIGGQLLLAKSKIAFEASVKFSGARVTDLTGEEPKRIYGGQQLALFGRYESHGPATVSLRATPPTEAKDAITNLGVNYQLVTDHTAMVVMSDESFAARGIERRNQQRTAVEHAAQAARANAPAKNYRVDTQQPAFPSQAPHVSRGGGGAIDRGMLALIIAIGALAAMRYFRRSQRDLAASDRSPTCHADTLAQHGAE